MPESDTALNILRNCYIRSLSFAIVSLVRAYDLREMHLRTWEETEEMIKEQVSTLKTYLKTMESLHYEDYPKEEICKCLKEYGESGEYALTDTYLNTDKRLYEQLLDCIGHATKELRKSVYDFVTDKFAGCLNINTGGYTGP